MRDWLVWFEQMDAALLLALLVCAFVALPTARRGGRFRALPGWVGFAAGFVILLLLFDHAPRWVAFSFLAALMFVALRGYFFVAPVRARDRYAILASYLAIPFALYPAWVRSEETFLATLPVALFLIIPVFLSLGRSEEGMLDSMGRTLLGIVFFVFCMAHLALMPELPGEHMPQLFGVLVLAAELPRRLAGNFHPGTTYWKRIAAVLIAMALAGSLGYWLAPFCTLGQGDGARAGVFVALAVTFGALVSAAVAKDLELSSTSVLVGRGALLNRVVPAVYAAPVYFHYLNHFA